MNLTQLARGARLTMVACVAATAVLLSGCSMPSVRAQEIVPAPAETEIEAAPPTDGDPQIDITKRLDPEMDEWVNSREGRDEAYAAEVVDILAEYGIALGIQGFESPNDAWMNEGYGGVAPFGDYCIAALYFDTESDMIALDILSRINYEVQLYTDPTTDLEALRGFADFYRTWCAEGGEWPGMPPSDTSDTTVDSEETSVSA